MSEIETLLEPMVEAARRAPVPELRAVLDRVRRRRHRRRAIGAALSVSVAAVASVAFLSRPDRDSEVLVAVGSRSVILPIGVSLFDLPPDLPANFREEEPNATGQRSEVRYGYDDRIFRIGADDAARSVTVVRTRGQNIDLEQQQALEPEWTIAATGDGEPALVRATAFWRNGGDGVVLQVSVDGFTSDEFAALMAGFEYDRAGDPDLSLPIPGNPENVMAGAEPGLRWRLVRTTTPDGPCFSINVGLTGVACLDLARPQGADLGNAELLLFRTGDDQVVQYSGDAMISSSASIPQSETIHAIVTSDPTGTIAISRYGVGNQPYVTCRWAEAAECLVEAGVTR